MAISKLQLVEIEFPETMSDEVLSKLVDSENFIQSQHQSLWIQ